MKHIVAIVGRPNVGKSTLFNRLIQSNQAITSDISHITRDRKYGEAFWNGQYFTVIDTGGYVTGDKVPFARSIRHQVVVAMQEAGAILFVTDCKTGLTSEDRIVADLLRRSQKPVLVVANKADNPSRLMEAHAFYELGLGSVYAIAAASGTGTGDLLDALVQLLPVTTTDSSPQLPRIAIIGRPNVGKSSLTNVLLQQERSIVGSTAGTTRDALDTPYHLFGKHFILTDTAGIRKRRQEKEQVNFYAVVRAINAMQKAEVCIMMIDASEGLTAQDLHLLALAHQYRKGIVLVVNKWDLIDPTTVNATQYRKALAQQLGSMSYIPILLTSVIHKKRIFQTIEKALEVQQHRLKRIPTAKLNDVILPIIAKTPPPSFRGHPIKVKYITQLPLKAPTFALFCNHPKAIKPAYTRYLEKQFRQHFNFQGIAIRLVFKQK